MYCLKIIILIITIQNCYSEKFKKCCPTNQFLQKHKLNDTVKYVCTDVNTFTNNENETIIPLKSSSSNVYGIPENCSDHLKCIDKTTDDNVIRLFCNSKIVEEHFFPPTLYKCCPNYMYYNTTSKSCNYNKLSSDSLIKDDYSSFYILKYGSPWCPDGLLVDYLIDSKHSSFYYGILEFQVNVHETYKLPQNLSVRSYCIDRLQNDSKIKLRYCINNYVEYCNTEISCIRKCCPMGQMYLKSKQNKITCGYMWNQTFEVKYSDLNGIIMNPSEKLSILAKPKCPYKRTVSGPASIFLNGSILIENKIYELNEYCMENFDSQTGLYGQNYKICISEHVDGSKRNIYYLIGLIISIVFLAITLVVYIFLPELLNLHGKTVMCHTASLLAAYIFLAIVKRDITRFPFNICITIGYCILFTFKATFCWLNVMCFDIWWTFGLTRIRGFSKRSNKKRFFCYCLYAFGLPFLTTILTFCAQFTETVPDHFRPTIGNRACWFDTFSENLYPRLVYLIYFAGPVGVLIFCNIILFILTMKNFLKTRSEIRKMQVADLNQKTRFLADIITLKMNLKLFIIMGITWMFEIIAIYQKEPAILWDILNISNVLQGFWIFCIFVLKVQVWRALQNRMGWSVKQPIITQTTSISAKGSVVSNNSMPSNEETTTDNKVN